LLAAKQTHAFVLQRRLGMEEERSIESKENPGVPKCGLTRLQTQPPYLVHAVCTTCRAKKGQRHWLRKHNHERLKQHPNPRATFSVSSHMCGPWTGHIRLSHSMSLRAACLLLDPQQAPLYTKHLLVCFISAIPWTIVCILDCCNFQRCKASKSANSQA
jgi:hypothetical protein